MSSGRKEASIAQPSVRRPQKQQGDSKCGGFQRRRINLKALMKKKGWSGKWSGKEEVKYVKFLQENLEAMEDEQARKKSRIFVKMSKFMRTRSSDQCRSHHQKLINYHKTVASIVDHFHQFIFPRMPPRAPKVLLTSPSNSNQISKESSFYSMTIIDNHITIEIDAWKIQDFRF